MNELAARILVFAPGIRTELEGMVARLPWSERRRVVFEPLGEDVEAAVLRALSDSRSVPLGVVVADESAVLTALAAGADEAVVLPKGAEPPTVSAFVDRLVLRGQRRIEQLALEESLAHAERLTALGTLVASVGHEINNPLTAVALSVDVVRRTLAPILDPDTELGRSMATLLDDLASATDSIARIVRDLKVFSRGDRGESPEVTDVQGLVEQALRLVARELSHVIVERDYPADLPRMVLPRNRVAQVLVNLLVNAAHATREVSRPSHRVRVSVRADEEFLAIAVSDTGPGIQPGHFAKIFEPFFTTKRGEIGTGLGLSISRAILRGLGGELTAESVHGDGATFIAFLPRPSDEELALGTRRAHVYGGAPTGARGCAVLVLEDDERVLRSYARLLSPAHRVVTARDAEEAFDAIVGGFEPDVILLALELAEGEGPRFLAELREQDPALLRRVLLVTSGAGRDEYADALRGHEGPILTKPVRGELLLAAIERLGGEPGPR
ncbi:MAG TPA: ATP-binding protein [Polyangiaceae bacterium]|nr:ATP-binding protein [Polyangiaceae bacterium]